MTMTSALKWVIGAALGSGCVANALLGQGTTTPAVTGLTARVTAQGTGSVSWAAFPGATSYYVVRWNAADVGCCKATSAPNLSVTASSWQDGTLPTSGTYTYRVYATTATGTYSGEVNLIYNSGVASTSSPSLNSSVTAAGGSGGGTTLSSGPTSTLPRPSGSTTQMNTGPAPTNLQITGGVTTASLQWDPVTGATGYQVARAPAGTTTWSQLTTKPITATSYPNDPLPDPRSTYTYQVTAIQAGGHYGVATRNYAPPPPADPTEFSAVQTAEHEVELSWRDAPGVTKYLVNGTGAASVVVPSNAQTLSIIGVYGKSTYKLTGVPNGAQSWTIASSYEPGGILTTSDKWPKTTVTVGALSGHYRVTMIGFDVNAQTIGDPFTDGRGDEVYLAAYVSAYNGAAGTFAKAPVRSRVYGDNNGFLGRITAGTLSPQGGLKTTDAYPLSGGGSSPPQKPLPDQFPMLLWEGTLTNDVDVLVIAPSIWESDNNDAPYADWIKGVDGYIKSATELVDRRSTAIAISSGVGASGYVAINGPGVDHPIGVGVLSSSLTTATYFQIYVGLTRQKIEAALTPTGIGGLAPGVLAVPLKDRAATDGFGGAYTVYLRVERLP